MLLLLSTLAHQTVAYSLPLLHEHTKDKIQIQSLYNWVE